MTLPPNLQAKYGRDNDYREWSKQMPVIPFKRNWNVTIIPPFGGAAARFTVEQDGAKVSVYADFDNSLGCYWDDNNEPLPCWEVYPYDDDTFRCDLDDVESLCNAIQKGLKQGGM